MIQMPIPTVNSSKIVMNQNHNQQSNSTIIPENELQVTTIGFDMSAANEFSYGVSATYDFSSTSSATPHHHHSTSTNKSPLMHVHHSSQLKGSSFYLIKF